MGFITNTGTTIELIAKLTPEGRRKLITNTNTLVSGFSLGDSDNYYDVFTGLTANQIPQISGDNNGNDSNNGGSNYKIKSTILYKPTIARKPVEVASISVNSVIENLGYKTVYYSGGSISQNKIDLGNKNTDSLVNLFYAFGLPISDSDYSKYTGTTSQLGGYSDTVLSAISQNNILVVGVSGDEYPELIDGKSIRLDITTTAATFNLYSTFEKKSVSVGTEDTNVRDSSVNISQFGPNVALLFSDTIQKPNSNASNSWATGYSQNKPFSVNGKHRYNYRANTTTGLIPDKAVGIAYLDKGFMVITDPTIVDNFSTSFSAATGTTITFDSVRNRVSQSITCIANRGEFNTSNNPTWKNGDVPRITEIGLWDATNTLIAIGKLNETYYKPSDDFVAFNISIDY